MAARAKITTEVQPPNAVSRHKTRKSAEGKDTASSSPVQRMQGKITLKNPGLIRRIIFDPSLETA
jgi:hypothetical protein